VKLTTHFHVVPRSKGCVDLFYQHALMAWYLVKNSTEVTLTFNLVSIVFLSVSKRMII